ncbi:sigma-54 interaction domain-containing protein [Sinanaerobacter sp. ZZT-01]|uniref:sigma-54 interaction domain-containing protein n=1 Tax=Sinanaerobacter sp. ZZT-01 TaxID=3111540 RepID=UPI002D7993C8|nr:sigma 54-interacting transcriptional regulator [Sinanaerobacter sp. ZZT-01]WRR94737.1 sigma 54-interacting transcriptional regulator [Sinanaerobacter sp. ZZT-01]
MKNKEYIQVLQKILQAMDEGIHVVDPDGNSIIYNRAMAQLEKMESQDVLRKPFAEVFKNMDESESTLMKAILHRKATLKKEQTYLNKDGKEITTVNTTFPMVVEGKLIAAIEIAKNITDIQKMSHTILELRKEIDCPEEAKELKIKKYNFDNLYGKNEKFSETVALAKKAAKSSASVLIFGETGTGKELIAQSIHFDSPRKHKPFLAQNCAALPANLLEGLLFGTAKGGFTGAVDRVGLFEQADGGTLLLDEINSMHYELQGKLLRVLQEDYIRTVGGTKDIPIDVRIIATINEPAEELIESGKFRKDLFYRLNIVPINIPPLRERRDDILLLTNRFMEKHNEKYGKQMWMLSEQAKEKLLDYDYPGNVRELENIIMGAISMAEDNEHVLMPEHLIINRRKSVAHQGIYEIQEGLDLYLEGIEREIIEHALVTEGGNISKAANRLKIKRQTLQHKIKKYKMNME